MKKLTKILALGLAAALLLAGCAIKTPATVGTVGDTTITAGVYLLAQYEAFVQAKALASETDVNAVLKATITDKDGNETTGADYVSAKTLEGVYRYAAAEQKYAEMGGELSESDLALITEQVDTQWESMEDTYTANGIGYQSLGREQLQAGSPAGYALRPGRHRAGVRRGSDRLRGGELLPFQLPAAALF